MGALLDQIAAPFSALAENIRYLRQAKQVAQRNRDLEQQLVALRHVEDGLRADKDWARSIQEKLRALQDVTIELAQIDKLDDFYRRAVELGRERLGFDRLGLFLTHDDPNEIYGAYGTAPDGSLRVEYGASYTLDRLHLVSKSIRGRRNIIVNGETEIWDEGKVIGRGWNAMAMLWDETHPIGWLAADSFIRHEPLRDEQLELLSLYASTLGVLLLKKNAEQEQKLHRDRLNLAVEVGAMRVWELRLGKEQIFYDPSIPTNERPLFPDFPTLLRHTLDEDRERLDQTFQQCLRDGTPLSIEFRVQSPDGKVLWLFSVGGAYRDAQGNLLGMIGVTQDITARKLAEEQVVELERQKERITLLNEFLGEISHDLKTPLTVMNTSLDLLQLMDDPERRARRINIIREQTSLVQRYIQDLLTISRLDDMPSLDMTPTDLNALINEVRSRLQPIAEQKHQALLLDLELPLPSVLGNPGELNRVLTNLVENALNYTPDNGSVTVRTRKQDRAVVTEISDTGIGIREAEIPLIFSRFYRTEAAKAKHDGGTGLGLAIVKRIVEIHHGRIEVESRVGEGSTFRVLLPSSAY
ncbi:MAG TPA: PAS domain-containing sensor histidine kinase [Phototrophicaceae bacterium]|nr:PAS domain-containing sensor histidine kinase [Phototrophicaceae bacterium]